MSAINSQPPALELRDLFGRYTTRAPEDLSFDRTVVPLQLVTSPQCMLASRAQAQRVALRLQRFRRVELDFDGLAEIGHGFADELLRVFAHQHPEVDLVPVNMAPRVAELMARELKLDLAWQQRQVALFGDVAKGYCV